MSKRIPCEMINDLLPLYIENLTSEVTNEEIRDHIADCENCKKAYDAMRSPEESLIDENEIKEIDFLKTAKKRTKRTIVLSVLAVAVLAIAILVFNNLIRTYTVNTDYVSCHLEVTGKTVVISGSSNDLNVCKAKFAEENGTVRITMEGRKTSHSISSFNYSFVANDYISEIYLGDKIVWSRGEAIAPIASNLYNTYHEYVGDMPANGKVLSAINLAAFAGNFTNELRTSETPYRYTLNFEKSYPASRENLMETRFIGYGCAILAEIGNLDEVVFAYSVDGVDKELVVTSDSASKMLGFNVKDAGKDINLLNRLVAVTGLDKITMENLTSRVSDDCIYIEVSNFTDSALSGMGARYSVDGEVFSNPSMINADSSLLSKGEVIWFDIIDLDLEEVEDETAPITVSFRVTDEFGNDYDVEGTLEISQQFGHSYKVNIYGNSIDGFYAKQ